MIFAKTALLDNASILCYNISEKKLIKYIKIAKEGKMIFSVAYFLMCNRGLLKFKAWLVDFFDKMLYNIVIQGSDAFVIFAVTMGVI
jgi:hypothetical protein